MSEERPQHPQEPAEGGEDEAEAPGADRSSEGRDTSERLGAGGGRPSDHPDEPAEGDEEDVGASGADRPG